RAKDTATNRYISYYFKLLLRFGGYEWNLSQFHKMIPHETEIFNAIDAAFERWTQSNAIEERGLYGDIFVQMTSYVSWYLHWPRYWGRRVQLCRQVTDQFTQLGTNFVVTNKKFIVGNLYVDEGWIRLARGELDFARNCVESANPLLVDSSDIIFAQE